MKKQEFLDNVADFVAFMGLTPAFEDVEIDGVIWTEIWLSGVKTDVAVMLEAMEGETELFDDRGLHKPTILYYLTIKRLEEEANRISTEMMGSFFKDGKLSPDLAALVDQVKQVMHQTRNSNPLDELLEKRNPEELN